MNNILKIAVFLLITFTSVNANAGGIYDGIYRITNEPDMIVTIHQKGNTMVSILIDNYTSSYITGIGTLTGNVSIGTTINDYSYIAISHKVTFTSPTTFMAVQTSCVPLYANWTCLHPNGWVSYGVKIF